MGVDFYFWLFSLTLKRIRATCDGKSLVHRIGRGERETRDGGGGLGLILFRPTLLMLILTGAEAKKKTSKHRRLHATGPLVLI